MWPRGQIIRPQPWPHSFWPPSRPRGIWPRAQKLASWRRIFTVKKTLINIHNIAIDNHLCCVLVAY